MKDGGSSTRQPDRRLTEDCRPADPPSAALELLAALVDPAGTLPTFTIQREALDVAQELHRLEARLDLLRGFLKLPPDALDLVGGRFKNETVEVTLYVVLGNMSASLRREARYLRKVALPRPHLDLRGVRLQGVER